MSFRAQDWRRVVVSDAELGPVGRERLGYKLLAPRCPTVWGVARGKQWCLFGVNGYHWCLKDKGHREGHRCGYCGEVLGSEPRVG